MASCQASSSCPSPPAQPHAPFSRADPPANRRAAGLPLVAGFAFSSSDLRPPSIKPVPSTPLAICQAARPSPPPKIPIRKWHPLAFAGSIHGAAAASLRLCRSMQMVVTS